MSAIGPRMNHDPVRVAALISGGGTTVANLSRHIAAGRLRAEIPIVVASNAKAVASFSAKGVDVPVELVSWKDYDSPAAFSDVVWQILRRHDVDIVCLAGFLSLLVMPEDFHRRVLNIHPALLPSFGGQGMFGHHVHEAVLAHGCKVSGCTVHFADPTYDTGPIIVQRCCPVLDDDTPDTLAARVFERECEAYPEAVRLVGEGRVSVQDGVARVAPGP